MEWIKTTEQFPSVNQIVLAVFDSGNSDWYKYPISLNVLQFVLRDSAFTFVDKSTLFPVNSAMVKYWMPIPESPEQ